MTRSASLRCMGFVFLLLLVASPALAQSFSVVSASVNPNPVSPGATATITVAIKNSGSLATGIVVDQEIYAASGARVNAEALGGQTFASGETKTYQFFWIPAPGQAGVYTVKIGIFAAHWTELYMWNNSAATLTVQASGPVVAFSIGTITASPTAIQPGGTVSITAAVTSTGSAASGIIVLLYLTDPFGNEFPGSQQVVEGQSFAPGQTRTYTFQYHPPLGATQGDYSAAFGVFNSSWSTLYDWDGSSQAFTVGTGQDPTFSIGSTTALPTPVARGKSVTITTHVKNTSSVPGVGIIVLCEINNAAGDTNFFWQVTKGLTFSPGQRRSVACVFPIPADFTPGTYSVDIGVFSGDWSTMYTWGFIVATFTVH
jgi:hypothetical protein